MAGSKNNPGRSNGNQVGGQSDRLVSEGNPREEAGVSYERYAPSGEAVVRREPSRTETDSLSGNGNRNG